MITLEQYFGAKPHTHAHTMNALTLIEKRNALRAEWMEETGLQCEADPDTGTEISGARNGAGDGGFRLSTSTTGKSGSAHKDAQGLDDYDPDNAFDLWLNKFEGENGYNSKLEEYDLYREHPAHTPGWCHLQTRRVKSGRRTFYP